ncbi:DUF6479 family protein [Streptomyces sp. NPDC090306]|uniref:DUF6479 family protein n=1 Tax=Streptomyces sp. NPDC090306 TaxID=3365961 RepID=UPI003814FD49
MNEALEEIAAGSGLLGIGLAVVAVVVVALLVGLFWFGARKRREMPPPPRPEEQPRLPEGGPVGEVREVREPNEMPRSDTRLLPHEVNGGGGSRTSDSQERPRWDEGGSGSFGSGGPGHG